MKKMKLKKYLPSALVLLLMATMLLTSCDKEPVEDEIPRLPFTPPPFEETAVVGTPENTPEDYGIIYDETRMSYMIGSCGKFVINADNQADVYFTNPSNNKDVWIKFRIYGESEATDVVCETGLIKRGEYIKTITFNREIEDGEVLTVKVMSYEPDTYYSMGEFSIKPLVIVEK